LDLIDRNKEELGQYNSLIGKLPSEVQGPLSLLTGTADIWYGV
jgi:hypothetical protein